MIILDFIRWALSHVKPSSIPPGAQLPAPVEMCGTDPWQYLFGSVRVMTDQPTLDLYYKNRYQSQMTRARFDQLTADWPRDGFATDCQGLLDAYLTYEKGEPTDINADMNYRLWCTDKGLIAEISRPWVIGEAVFKRSGGRMTHVGWICGFLGGEPLVVEARGIAFGVVVTKLSERDFTHRALMTGRFEYNEQDETEENEMGRIIFEKTSPMKQGEAFLAMQKALNAAGYRDANGSVLEEDGKWGRRSDEAFTALLQAHSALISAPAPEPEPELEPIKPVVMYKTGEQNELTVCIFRSEDLPEA